MTYLIKCAWCGNFRGTKFDNRPDFDGKTRVISHSICPECRENVRAEARLLQYSQYRPVVTALEERAISS